MTDLVKRKLKVKSSVEEKAPAASPSASKKVRRVRKAEGPPEAACVPVVEQTETVAPVVKVPEPRPPAPAPKKFPCLMCGIALDEHTEECPICGERYVEVPNDALAELERAEMCESEIIEQTLKEGEDGAQCVVFDADEGVIDYLEKDSKSFEVALICSGCGTAVEFATDKCPICGTDMENPDAGLVGLVSEMTFEEVEPGELVCPQCGELVNLTKGKCPMCKSIVLKPDPHGILRRLDPIIHGDNVIFLHLDVESGELNYLQKGAMKEGIEKMKVRLEGI